MIRDFTLPDLGEGLTESEVVSWRVAVGDRIELNQIVADVETAKAVVELPSPFAGVVASLHAEPGQVVKVGQPLISFETGQELDDSPQADGETADETAAEAGSMDARLEPTLVGYGAAADAGAPRRRPRRSDQADATVVPATPVTRTDTAERPRSTPPVRKLARDLGIDLEQVEGTGDRGLITRDDVEAAAGRGTAQPPSETEDRGFDTAGEQPASRGPADRAQPGRGESRIPIRSVRKHTAAAMVRSAFTAPHVTEFLTVDVTATMQLLESIRERREYRDHRVTPLTVAAKALCIALQRNPSLNTRWDEQAQEIVQFHHVHLGIAAATDRGLVVPNIPDADLLTLLELGDAITDLAATARQGKTPPEALSGGTISITNIGVFGIDAGTPILNPGEAAILATGAVRKQPWEYRGEIVLRDVMTLSLSFDHRLVDGEEGSRFLSDIGTILRDPGLSLTMI